MQWGERGRTRHERAEPRRYVEKELTGVEWGWWGKERLFFTEEQRILWRAVSGMLRGGWLGEGTKG